jgi:hypothetical protein
MEKGDFEFPIVVHGEDEVAELTRAFAQMRKSLRLSREGMLRSARLEAVGRLAGGIAHDFNNLVMIIKGYSDLVLESANDETRPHQSSALRSRQRLTRVCWPSAASRCSSPCWTSITRAGYVEDAPLLLGEDIELPQPFRANRPVKADPGQQVIMNLAVNARDALPGVQGDYRNSVLWSGRILRGHSRVAPGDYAIGRHRQRLRDEQRDCRPDFECSSQSRNPARAPAGPPLFTES